MRRIGTVCDYNDEIEVHANYFSLALIVSHGCESVNVELDKKKVEQLIKLLQEGLDRL